MKRRILFSLACAGMLLFPQAIMAQGEPIIFSATGDVPYASSEDEIFQQQIADHNLYSPSEFFVHLGDIKTQSAPCDESVYRNVSGYLKELAVPVFVVPGDNETTDCTNEAQAWAYWVQYFMDFELNFCGAPFSERQAIRPENFAFISKGILFIGINLVSGVSSSIRMDDADWVEQQLQQKVSQVRGAVIFSQCGPSSGRADFFDRFVTAAQVFAKPILFLHGDGHTWTKDYPFPNALNVLRVEVEDGVPEEPVQITVTMDPQDMFVFLRNPFSNNPIVYNVRPCVQVGADTTINFPGEANLHAQVSDDRVPLDPGATSLTWSKISGPGTVNFNDPSAANTTADFTAPGIYLLRLTANDGELENYDELTVTVDGGGAYLAIDDVQVTEGNSGTVSALFTVMLSGSASQVVSVNYTTADGSALQGSDYIAKSGTLTFSDGETNQTISVSVNGDLSIESDETFFVNLSGAVNATISDDQGIGFIIDDDSPPTADFVGAPLTGPAPLSVDFTDQSSGTITDYSWDFGDGNTSFLQNPTNIYNGVGTYTVSLTVTGPTGSNTKTMTNYITVSKSGTVSFQDSANGYQGTRDTQLLSGSPDMNYGTTSSLSADGSPDQSVLLYWDVSAIPPGSTIEGVTITLNITNISSQGYEFYELKRPWAEDEATWNQFAAGQSWEIAGADGPSDRGSVVLGSISSSSTGLLQVSLNASGLAVVESWVDNPSSNHGLIIQDYVNNTNGLDFSSREAINFSERPELTVNYSNSGGSLPALAINDVGVAEGNSGAVNATFTVSLSPSSSQTVTVDYATADGTANAPDDYTAVPLNTLSFAAGEVSKTITVAVNGDVLDEPDETFLVNLTNPGNATIADNQGQGTISDDDPAPLLSINDVSADEGAGTMTFTVSLSAVSGQAVSIDFTTTDGTAVAPDDYTATSSTLTIPTGSPSGSIMVTINEDTLSEGSETFSVDLSNAVNATIADNQGTGTITDNEGLPALAINDVGVTEGNSGAVNATFTVSLSPSSSQTVTVDYATADGTANAPDDYTAVPLNTLSFAAGEVSKTITVAVNGDVLDEPDETFLVNLTNPGNATIADNQGQGTISDDDPAPLLSINDVSADEGAGTMTFTVSLSAVSGQAVSIDFTTTDGTAVAPDDYTATSGMLTIPAGALSDTIAIDLIDDIFAEPSETFFIDLSNPVNAGIVDPQGIGTITDIKDVVVAVTHRETQTGQASNSGMVTTSSILIAADGDLYLAAISSNPNTAVNAVTGLGLSWTLLSTQCASGNAVGLEVWYAQGNAAALDDNVSASFSTTVDNAVITVSRYSGVDLSVPVSNILSGNPEGLSGSCNGRSKTSTYAFNLVTTSDASVVYNAATATKNAQHSPGVNFTERADISQGNGKSQTMVAVQDKTVPLASNTTIDGLFDKNVEWAVIGLAINPTNTTSLASSLIQNSTIGSEESMVAAWPDPEVQQIPQTIALMPNYPNPFNLETRIEYALPVDARVRITIYNSIGQQVSILIDETQTAGYKSVTWNGTSDRGGLISSGIYFVQLIADNTRLVRRMILAK